MSCSKEEQFFTKDPLSLFSNGFNINPLENISFDSKMNAIARLIIITGGVLFVLGYKYSLHFLVLGLLFVIVIYYLGRKKQCSEHYDDLFFSEVKEMNNEKEIIPIGNSKPIYIPNIKASPQPPLIGEPVPGRWIYTNKDGEEPKPRDDRTPKEILEQRIADKNLLSPPYSFENYEEGNPSCIVPIDHGTNQRQFVPPIIATPAYAEDVWPNSSAQFGNHNNGEYLQPFIMEDSYVPKSDKVIGMDDIPYSGNCIPQWLYDGDSRYTLQSIQPGVYVDYRDEQPINFTNGISQAYTRPPLYKNQACGKDNVTIYSRIDPQLIRDDVPLARAQELPTRDQHSAKYSDWEAKRGSYDADEINNIERYNAVAKYTDMRKADYDIIDAGAFLSPPPDPEVFTSREGYSDFDPMKSFNCKTDPNHPACKEIQKKLKEGYSDVDVLNSKLNAFKIQSGIPVSEFGYIPGEIIGTDYVDNNPEAIKHIQNIKSQLPPEPKRDQQDYISLLNARTSYETQQELDATRGDLPSPISQADIVDTRNRSYADPLRAYYDIEKGDIQYYYGDVDSYKYPVFTTRTKVDHIDYTDPMGRVLPRYVRENCSENKWACKPKELINQNVEYDLGLDQVREQVEDAFTRDSIFFRESLMESQMGRDNARRWQFKYRPIKKLGAGYRLTT